MPLGGSRALVVPGIGQIRVVLSYAERLAVDQWLGRPEHMVLVAVQGACMELVLVGMVVLHGGEAVAFRAVVARVGLGADGSGCGTGMLGVRGHGRVLLGCVVDRMLAAGPWP